MLLKIDIHEGSIISNEGGRIIVKLHFSSEFANGAHFAVTDGETMADFIKNPAKSRKTLFVGCRGGLSLD